jgi:hypothetical protein
MEGGWKQGVLTVPVVLLVSCGVLVGGSGRHGSGAVIGRVISIVGIVLLVRRSPLVDGARRKGVAEINLLPCGDGHELVEGELLILLLRLRLRGGWLFGGRSAL